MLIGLQFTAQVTYECNLLIHQHPVTKDMIKNNKEFDKALTLREKIAYILDRLVIPQPQKNGKTGKLLFHLFFLFHVLLPQPL